MVLDRKAYRLLLPHSREEISAETLANDLPGNPQPRRHLHHVMPVVILIMGVMNVILVSLLVQQHREAPQIRYSM